MLEPIMQEELFLWAFRSMTQYWRELNSSQTSPIKGITKKELDSFIKNISLNEEEKRSEVKYESNPDNLLQAESNTSSGNNQLSNAQIFCQLMDEYLNYSVRSGHRRFFNQLYGGIELPALLADIFTSLTNISIATYEMAPLGTLIEKTVINKLLGLVGMVNYETNLESNPKVNSETNSGTNPEVNMKGEGILVPGGSYANMMAMLAARNYLYPEIKEYGISAVSVKDDNYYSDSNSNSDSNSITVSNSKRSQAHSLTGPLVAFISEEAHYSFFRAANIVGIGRTNIRKVAVDEEGRMNAFQLETAILSSREKGERPFFIGATAGTTVTGAIDPIRKLATIANKYGIWLHVDGALGGALLFSKKYAALLDGAELADSFSWDAHKGLGVPLLCSAVLFKKGGMLASTCSGDEGEYLFHMGKNDNRDWEDNWANSSTDSAEDLGKLSLQCGRRVDALKLWGVWKFYGDIGLAKRVERLLELIKYAERYVNMHPRLELLINRQSFTLCFRYNPIKYNPRGDLPKNNLQTIEELLDQLNLSIRNQIIIKGKFMVNYSRVKGKISLRLVTLNPQTNEKDLESFFKEVIYWGDLNREKFNC